MIEQADIIGCIAAICILYAAFRILHKDRVDTTTQFISMILLAVVVGAAPGRIIQAFSIKTENVTLKTELETAKNDVRKLIAYNDSLRQGSIEKVHNLEKISYAQEDTVCAHDFVSNWADNYEEWMSGIVVPSSVYYGKPEGENKKVEIEGINK